MGFVVKNTTTFGLLDLLCPHTCRGCGRLGAVLCECCKKNLLAQTQPICLICKRTVAKTAKKVKNMTNGQFSSQEAVEMPENSGKIAQNVKSSPEFADFPAASEKNIQNIQQCPDCETPFWGLWSFGWREGVLEKLVKEYKYQSVRGMGKVLVELYDTILPQDLENVVVVPLPTIGRHVRERGFDHTLTLAKKLARLRGWQCQQVLTRAADTVQVGARMADRKTQAAKAYAVYGKIDPQQHYLLLDDVWTTGSTMLAAEKVLRAAGAEQISAVVLAISRSKTAGDAA